jgi:hypothetical protein
VEKELVDKIAGILREEGFTRVTRQKSSVSQTLTAERDGLHVVVHMSEGREVPTSAAAAHSAAPKGIDIMMKATLPGLHGAPGSEALRTLRQGGSGTASGPRRERSTRAYSPKAG